MSEKGNAWRRELLSGVAELSKQGLPGPIVLFGENAHGIAAGEAASDLFAAAAPLGKGRVLAFGHGGYPLQFRIWALGPHPDETVDDVLTPFWSNAYKWLLNGGDTGIAPSDVVVDIHAKSALAPADFEGKKIAVWSGGDAKSSEYIEAVTSFVLDGGSLVCGCTPWGFLQIYPDMTLEDLSMNMFVQQCGMAYAPTTVKAGDRIEVANNPAASANIRHSLKRLLDADGIGLDDELVVIAKNLQYVPQSATYDLTGSLTAVYNMLKTTTNSTPGKGSPVDSRSGKAAMSVGYFLYSLGSPGQRTTRSVSADAGHLPGTEEFPGIFPGPGFPDLLSAKMEVAAPVQDFFSTGLYAVPGVDMEVEILSQNTDPSSPWIVYIGCHTDKNQNCGKYIRWPEISTKVALRRKKTTVKNIFGGGVYLCSPKSEHVREINFSISNVVEAPRIDITDEGSVDQWKDRRNAPGLWADLSGRYITFTVPSASIRDLDDPVPVLRFWDRVIAAHHDLKGTNINRKQRQWIVYDVQPHNGYMHAGYPIMASLTFPITARFDEIKEFTLNFEYVKTNGCWGVFHEMGHNMQDSAWTFDGTLEVTCNIFTLHAMERVVGIPAWIHPWVKKNMGVMKEHLNGKCDLARWKEHAGIGIGVYAQLAHNFGWTAFQKVFRKYASISLENSGDSNQAKIDTWIVTFSDAVGYNIGPMFDFWAVPVTDGLAMGLPPFLPDDEMTQMAPGRVDYILGKYPNCVRAARPPYYPLIGEPAAVGPPFVTRLDF